MALALLPFPCRQAAYSTESPTRQVGLSNVDIELQLVRGAES
jgi:hypothetical protein